MAINTPGKFVLKPQREGGGNNFYNDDVKIELEKMKDLKDRTGWILMDRICPTPQKNYLIRSDSGESNKAQDVISELGIYGVIIG